MKALLQRVGYARVRVAGEVCGEIAQGLLVFVGVEKNDTEILADRLLEKLLNYRVFADDDGKMNRNVREIQGGLLLVSQFTLAADTGKGLRPSFSRAAPPEQGARVYHYLLQQAQRRWPHVASGRFGADMQVELLNDGPVTFLLEVATAKNC